jgi:hypothetical protein
MRTLHKILFEVKVYHEYYLTDPQGNSIFGLAAQGDRLQFLAGRFATDVSAVNEDFLFYLGPEQQALFRNNHLVLLNSYSGCQVAVEVNASTESDGSIVYSPVIPLAGNLNMLIGIAETRNFIDQVTNARMNRPVSAARYFSNEQVFAPKVFPSLSTALQTQQAGYVYEQGELASFGPGDVRAYYDYNNTDQWLPVTGVGFSGEQDRLVVSPRFFYVFLASDGVRNASFVLKDSGGNTIDTRAVSNPTPLGQVVLDYSNLLKAPPVLKTLPQTGVGAGLLYTLSVTGDNGYNRQVSLIFYMQDPHAAPSEDWGYVQVQTTVSNSYYNLLDTTGLLITRIKGDGTIVLHPVFEIWLKSRFTYWRYRNDEDGTLQTPTPDIGFFLDLVDGELITKTPRNITYRPTYFYNPNDSSYHYLPNPESETVPETDVRQVYSNIPVPESSLFPIT